MAFGQLTNKFRILKKVMSGSLCNIVRKIAACATLHNFIIAEDGVQDTKEPKEQAREENKTTTPFGMNYHPTLPDRDVFTGVAGVSHMRDALLELICELDMRCPQNNLLQNAISFLGMVLFLNWNTSVQFKFLVICHYSLW